MLSNFPHTNTATGPDGTDWIGPVGGGVSCFDGIKWETYTVSDAFDLEYVKAIIKAPDGSMWFGTEGEGVYRFDGKD
ncbi:MAG: hypothetical protein JXA13_03125 [Anaerolineales bacterium]|nr:hypothetical protein [Anaerolineales bacterium]